MINKYPTIYEIQEVLNSTLITRTFLNQFAQKRGIFLINSSKEELVKELASHLYEYADLDEIRKMAYQCSNKQVLSGFTILPQKETFNLEALYDNIRNYGNLSNKGYNLKALTKKTQNETTIYHGEVEYIKRKSGKIEFLQDEKFYTDFYFYQLNEDCWQVEVDGTNSSDGKEVMKLMKMVINENSAADIVSLEIDNLDIKNVITFFDRLSKEGLDVNNWILTDIKQLTFKRRKDKDSINEDEEDNEEEILEEVDDENLGGISQAVLEGRNLREHSFVKQAEKGGCIFTAITYEFENLTNSEIVNIKAEFKGSPKIFEVSIVSTGRNENIKKKRVYYSADPEYKRNISSEFWNNAKRIYLELIEK